jgi:hypothetical protein
MKTLKNRLKVGDIIQRTVRASWDDEIPINITGKIILLKGRKFFEGIETNEFNDFLDSIRQQNKIKVK